MLRLLEKAQQVYASCGITTVQEGYMRDRELPLLCRAAEDGRLFLDTVGYIDIKEHAGQMQQYGGRWKDYHGHFRIGGYKLFLDGSPQGRTAWMTRPLRPQEGQPSNYRGYPIYSDAPGACLCAAGRTGASSAADPLQRRRRHRPASRRARTPLPRAQRHHPRPADAAGSAARACGSCP